MSTIAQQYNKEFSAVTAESPTWEQDWEDIFTDVKSMASSVNGSKYTFCDGSKICVTREEGHCLCA